MSYGRQCPAMWQCSTVTDEFGAEHDTAFWKSLSS
jgi:hypothetical protein